MTAQHRVRPRMAPAPAELVRPMIGMPEDTVNDPDGPLAHVVGSPVPNILGVLGNHPALLKGVYPMLAALGEGRLPLRDSELIVLGIGYYLRSRYEWAHHVAIGSKAGLTEAEIKRVTIGPDAPGWSAHDAALLRVIEELHSPQARVSDKTWRQLSLAYDEQQLLEVLVTVGSYSMLAYIISSCDVQIEDWYADPPALP